jgi:aspartate racemase
MNDDWFGLIGGLGVGATVHYYRELAKKHADAGQTMRLLIAHADVTSVLAYARNRNVSGLASYLAGIVERLSGAGATVAAISAVTPHLCYPELRSISALPLIDIVGVTSRELKARGLRRVALFGTRFVIETDFFGALEQVEVVRPEPDEIDEIHRIYSTLIGEGQALAGQRDRLTEIANAVLRRDAVDAIVLAGTELSLVFDSPELTFPAVDCTRLHVQAIAARMLSKQP